MPAMGLAYTDDYSFNDRFKAFYRARAHGGVGLMTVGPLGIDTVGQRAVHRLHHEGRGRGPAQGVYR